MCLNKINVDIPISDILYRIYYKIFQDFPVDGVYFAKIKSHQISIILKQLISKFNPLGIHFLDGTKRTEKTQFRLFCYSVQINAQKRCKFIKIEPVNWMFVSVTHRLHPSFSVVTTLHKTFRIIVG